MIRGTVSTSHKTTIVALPSQYQVTRRLLAHFQKPIRCHISSSVYSSTQRLPPKSPFPLRTPGNKHRGNNYYLRLRINRRVLSMAATASSNDDDIRTRGQQSPLASQRKNSNAQSETKSKGRFSGFFPLGYKEAYSQWVGPESGVEGPDHL